MFRIRSLGSLIACLALVACAPPDVSVPPPNAGAPSVASNDGGGDPDPGAAPAGANETASARDQGRVDGPGDRGGLGKEDVVALRAAFACADKRIGPDEAARAQAYAEIITQHGTQQKWLDQVMEDIKEEPELEKQLLAKIAAKAEELCGEGGPAPAGEATDAAGAPPAEADPASEAAPAADDAGAEPVAKDPEPAAEGAGSATE